MKNAQKHLLTVALVAGGVVAAGYAMAEFKDSVPFLKKAQNGFQGIA